MTDTSRTPEEPRTYFPDEVGIALCLYGEDLEPPEVSAVLGAQPTVSHRRGDKKGLKSPPFQKRAWIREIRRFEPVDPDAMVRELFASLTKEASVWEKLDARFEIQLRVGIHTDVGCGLFLSPVTVDEIAKRHASINLDIYAYGNNEG